MTANTNDEGSQQRMTLEQRRRKNRKGFTLVEILVASTIMGFGLIIALPQLRGFSEGGKLTGSQGQARALVTAVNIYRLKNPGVAITGTAVKPMTVARANTIYGQIGSYTGPNGEVIVDAGFTLSGSATFPSGWGETAAGIFDPIP